LGGGFVDGGSVAVGAVVVSQGIGYCKYQGDAFVNLFLMNPVEGGRHFELWDLVAGPGSQIPEPPQEDGSTGGGRGRGCHNVEGWG